ncbi:hypothetical protein [Clostridium sp. SHJSY1]|nr:hypothetical protein [Clostridium sp. SHJSY1]
MNRYLSMTLLNMLLVISHIDSVTIESTWMWNYLGRGRRKWNGKT